MNLAADIPVDAIRAASRRTDVPVAIESLYRELDAGIAAHTPTCWNKGVCCRFGEYGHRLYVTTLEAAYYLAIQSSHMQAGAGHSPSCRSDPPSPSDLPSLSNLPSPPDLPSLPVLPSGPLAAADVCPHAHDGRCHARAARPMGCRIFYCDPAAQGWQGTMTERYLARLRALHESLGVPYFYGDWMKVLAALSDSEKVRK